MTKKILERLLAIFFLACATAWGQAQPPSTYQPQLISFNGTPFGTCTVDLVALNVSNGAFYSCNPMTHTWVGAQAAALPISITQGGFTHTLTGATTAPRTWTLQDASDTFVFRSTTDTLANKSFSTQIISTVATGTAPLSIASTTQVANLNASQLGGLTAPASAIVGISDTQTLTNKALTSPTLDGFGAAHVVNASSAATNFGVALSNQTIIASMPSTGTVSILAQAIQTTVGVGCSAVTNSVSPSISFTAPGGTVESYAPGSLGLSFSGNGVIDQGDTPNLTGPTQFVVKSGTAVTFSTASTLGSTGCTTVPQYTLYAKAFF